MNELHRHTGNMKPRKCDKYPPGAMTPPIIKDPRMIGM